MGGEGTGQLCFCKCNETEASCAGVSFDGLLGGFISTAEDSAEKAFSPLQDLGRSCRMSSSQF